MKTQHLVLALLAVLLVSDASISEARRLTDAEQCELIVSSQVSTIASSPSTSVQALTYQQRLDHYDHQDDRTFTQRYWISDEFWAGAAAGAPIFLALGGESPASSLMVTGRAMTMYAAKHKALQVGIEHRYYGQSQPFPQLDTQNLKWLSSQQALADAAELILYVREQYKAYNSPIITFGCSYSGALSAWFRMKYPHITLGSIASSAPVEATLDFYQYLQVVDKSLNYFSGPSCSKTIAEATSQIESQLSTSSGRSQIGNRLGCCSPIESDLDVSMTMQNLMGNWQGLVQYNLEKPNTWNVSAACDRLAWNVNRGMSALDAYIEVTNHVFPPGQCLDCKYQSMVDDTANTNVNQSMRQWTYQTCTEFAYFQTTDSSYQPFGNKVPVKFWIDFCKDVYGKDFQPALKVKQSNEHYGGQNLPTFIPNNILFVNGNIDPWHSLSIYEEVPNAPYHTVFVDGTAHCADSSLTGDRAPPQLQVAQQKIADVIGQWLSDYKPSPQPPK